MGPSILHKGHLHLEYHSTQASWIIWKILKARQYLENTLITRAEFLSQQNYSIKNMYNRLRGTYTKIQWKKLICNNQGSPKWLFILYLALQRKLYTKDRLIKLGRNYSPTCPLCEGADENIRHIFFLCPISALIWQKILHWQGISKPVPGWLEEQNWAKSNAAGNNSKAEIYRMPLAGCVYYLWQERNQRLFQNKKRTKDTMLGQIIQDIHYRGTPTSQLAKQFERLNFYP
ncbi:uncharacterized protein LOC132612070 [Lycium barbarum]|uniref:uncharacterized protein LOC132612070 n=1 Tax=Lycium barbarum TaxID=112863 RepID=UPI00293F5FCB|nr:uncharacterized protein LOC132612070 [Lycium barbarum]